MQPDITTKAFYGVPAILPVAAVVHQYPSSANTLNNSKHLVRWKTAPYIYDELQDLPYRQVGVVLGTLFGWLGSYMVFSLYGKTVFPFEWGMNGIVLVVAAIAALLASVFPARRAVKTPPVEALAEA